MEFSLFKKNVLVIIAHNGFNEIEFQSVKKMLMAKGYLMFIASNTNSLSIGENGMRIKADVSFFNMNESNFDALVIIGGTGIKDYWDNPILVALIKAFNLKRKPIAAICGAPIILAKAGILDNSPAVCYSKHKSEFIKNSVEYIDTEIVVNKNIITARDFNASEIFADAILNSLKKK